MPTAAKLVGAICLSLSAMLIIVITVGEYSTLERKSVSMLITAGFVGLFVGWLSLGKLVAKDEGSGAISGVRAGISTILWVLALFSLNVMIAGMLSHSYFQPMQALLQIPQHMIVFGFMGLKLNISLVIVVLALVSGIATKRVHNRWP